ncbi:MAG: hypothetical protein KKH98_14255 [Spirochaetes bacterium]|nr:hypothetical protein [Spirochaetota bacterium]
MNKLKRIWKWLKWAIPAIGFFWVYGVFKAKAKRGKVDKEYIETLKKLHDKREDLEKEKKDERNRIKDMGVRDRISDIKRLLNNTRGKKKSK